MLKDPNLEPKLSQAAAPRPCAFYHAAMLPMALKQQGIANRVDAGATSGLSHRCILNPGRSSGPDGEEIGPAVCTPARQAVCQGHRRMKIARLHATLPAPRAAEAIRA